jgi:flagellar biosynthetic protein FliP
MKKLPTALLVLITTLLLIPNIASAQTPLPKISVSVEEANTPQEVAQSIQIVILLTILALAPSILIMVTSFSRIAIVFHFLRSALSTQTVPSNQILVSLALFLTFFIMRPVFNEINTNAIQPYLNAEISQQVALQETVKPIKSFMLKHVGEKELELFVNISGAAKPQTPDELKLSTIIPAFIISEIKIAFQIGFLIYLPMLLIDLIIASILLSMGMMMLPPVMISLPFKLLLFVLVDGWYLIVESLVKGFL